MSSFYLRKEKQFNSGTIRVQILPKIDTKGLQLDDVAALCDKSFHVMLSAFRSDAESRAQRNGPLRR
ncbi:1-acyl-sn-glycerol-3-phosphate acyltransferase alpha [Liparis tanakae]|uniref:1-acyl-sn-glycerol-3-phosphate acyltransferase alpha n=1 Tax=Liparis tanakae TaxID=230148 RepID=A0A4Z2EEF0_9TELE|nr:1-acyl-sn-glycerol-3-phosphate acyltransferase alpha [Liparis tanakae]